MTKGRGDGGSRLRRAREQKLVALSLAVLWLAIVTGSAVGAQTPPHSFIWKATSKEHSVYLLGSVHLLSQDYYPLRSALESAYDDSDLLVEEVNPGELFSPQSQMQMLSSGLLPSDQSLEKTLSPASYALVIKRITDMGLPPEPLMRFKPWMLSIVLLGMEWNRAGFTADLGLDQHFYNRAQRDAKATQGLETVAYQISRLDEMPLDEQERFLTESLDDLDSEEANINKLAEAWQNGDVPTIERLVLSGLKESPDLYQRLLVDRNRVWLPKLEALFERTGHALVVVGAAHLVGPDGLLAMLHAKGYVLEQL